MRYAVNNSNAEEVAVYLGLVWQLTNERMPFAIPACYRDDAARWLGKDCALVDWEYEVDDLDRHVPALAADERQQRRAAARWLLLRLRLRARPRQPRSWGLP